MSCPACANATNFSATKNPFLSKKPRLGKQQRLAHSKHTAQTCTYPAGSDKSHICERNEKKTMKIEETTNMQCMFMNLHG